MYMFLIQVLHSVEIDASVKESKQLSTVKLGGSKPSPRLRSASAILFNKFIRRTGSSTLLKHSFRGKFR